MCSVYERENERVCEKGKEGDRDRDSTRRATAAPCDRYEDNLTREGFRAERAENVCDGSLFVTD